MFIRPPNLFFLIFFSFLNWDSSHHRITIFYPPKQCITLLYSRYIQTGIGPIILHLQFWFILLESKRPARVRSEDEIRKIRMQKPSDWKPPMQVPRLRILGYRSENYLPKAVYLKFRGWSALILRPKLLIHMWCSKKSHIEGHCALSWCASHRRFETRRLMQRFNRAMRTVDRMRPSDRKDRPNQ